MRLTRIAVERPIGTGLICAAVVLIGIISVRQLAIDLLPEVDFPRISIVTSYPGVGPEEIETLITRPIEQTVATIDGIEEINAVSAEGLSRIQLQFAWGTNLDAAVNDVRAYLDRLANRLPEDADRPVVYKFDLASVPVATIGLSGGGDSRRLRYLADETLSRRLERVPGVASVTVRGGRVREIRVELDAGRLVSLGVSATEIVQALRADNRNVSAGDMRETGREVLVRAVGEWQSPEQVAGTLVATREGRPVYVRDVATVLDTFQEAKNELWVNGEPGITLRVAKQSGGNTVEVVEGLRAEIERINLDYEGRLRVWLLTESGEFIKSAVTNVQYAALFGASLAVMVLLFFLRDVRATMLIAVAIPFSVVASFALMYFADYTLNVISFGGLALGIGMLVDNAIVILENIHRKREQGLAGARAAIEGAREVGSAVLAGTLTTISVFAPVLFLGGFAGIFFAEMAGVVSFSLGCSLLVALTLVPSLAARVLRKRVDKQRGALARIERGMGDLERGYGWVLRRVLREPWYALALAVLLLAASTRLVPLVGLELMPETDEGTFDVDMELPVGTPVERTAVVIRDMEQRVRAVVRPDELAHIVTSAGPANWFRPGGGHEGEVEVTLVPVSQRERGIDEIMADVRKAVSGVPDASIRMRKGSSNFLMRLMRGSSGERLVVEVRGHDLESAAALAGVVRDAMSQIEGVADVRVEREEGLEERTVEVDAARAADLGLTRAEVAGTLETYVLGTVAARFRDRGDEFDVRVQLREEDRRDLERLGALPIITRSGDVVPLSSVAAMGGRKGPTSISRVDQERVLRVFGGLGERPLSEVVVDVRAALDRIELPENFSLAISGEHEQQQETFGGLAVGIVLAILLVYAVMGVQFESLRHPLVVMAALPFGFVGVIATLVITGTTLNMNSFLGAIVLVGIAVNNAIVLVDYTNMLRRESGLPLEHAVLEAGRRRLRPILMTTMTTALAMLPLALNLGEGSEIQAPLARVVVGGLIVSAAVTVFLVPCLYYVMERRRAAATAPDPDDSP
jgi:hydrophobic/amphiphilic exporter-1 (mainly G- bacteria), HAE1 family